MIVVLIYYYYYKGRKVREKWDPVEVRKKKMGPTKRWEMRITENPADLIQTQRSWLVFGLSLGKEACGPIFYRSICIWECGPKKILHLTSPFHFFTCFIKKK